MIHTLYTHISRRSGFLSILIPLLTLVGGLERMARFFI